MPSALTVEDKQRGERLRQIRTALGVDQAQFAALATSITGTTYGQSRISRMENGFTGMSFEDCARLARLDPLKRGRVWLAWGLDGPDSNAPAAARRRAKSSAPRE